MSSYIPQTSKHKLHTRKYIHTLQQRHKCVVPQDSRRAISAAQHIPLHPFTGAFTNAPPPTAREPPARLLWGAALALCRCRFRVCVCVCVRERESERSYYSAKTTTFTIEETGLPWIQFYFQMLNANACRIMIVHNEYQFKRMNDGTGSASMHCALVPDEERLLSDKNAALVLSPAIMLH